MTCNHKTLIAIALTVLLLGGCAARKPAIIKPGHDLEHPPLKLGGKAACHVGLLWIFHSYGPKNCKNEEGAK